MPSKSKKQRRFMAAAANNPKFAKKAGIKSSVAKEFHNADKKQKFAFGGLAMASMMQNPRIREMMMRRGQPQQSPHRGGGNDMRQPPQRRPMLDKSRIQPQGRVQPGVMPGRQIVGGLGAAQGPQAPGAYNRTPQAPNRSYGPPRGANPAFSGRFGNMRPQSGSNVPPRTSSGAGGPLAGARMGITPGNRENPLLGAPRAAMGRRFRSFR